jgi:hypothetical protein
MSQSARVTSVEAVKEFRPALIIFCEQAKDALSSVDMETRNLLDWLQRDQLGYWQRQLRLRQEEVSEAKAELFRRQLPGIRGEKPDCLEEKKALRIAQMRLEEAEDKIENCKRWSRLLPRAVDDYIGPARRLAGLVEGDCPPPLAQINRILEALHAYIELAPPRSPLPAASSPAPTTSPKTVVSSPAQETPSVKQPTGESR